MRALVDAMDARERESALSQALPLVLDVGPQCLNGASSSDVFRELLSLGADINATLVESKDTFLMRAIDDHNLQLTQAALSAGANPNKGGTYMTPLVLAIHKQDEQIVRMLLAAGALVNFPLVDRQITTPLAAAARYPGVENVILKLIIDSGARYPARTENQPLDDFAEWYHGRSQDTDETVKLLIFLGAKVNRCASPKDECGGDVGMYSPLYRSVQSMTTSIEVIRALLRHGANPNQYVLYALGNRRDDSAYPLKRRDILEELFQHGARISRTPKRNGMNVRKFLIANPPFADIQLYLDELDEVTLKYARRRKR